MNKIFPYILLFTTHIVLPQFGGESSNEIEVDSNTEEVVLDESIILQKTELLKKIDSYLLNLNQLYNEPGDYSDNGIKFQRYKYSLLLYMIEFSQVNFIDVKWAKGIGGCKLVLIGEDGKMYGGTNWFGKSIPLKTKMDCKTKIKNKELQETKIGGSIVVGRNSSFNSKNYNLEFTPKWFLDQHLTKYPDNEQGYIDYKFGDF